jgi:fused signal recognition particle receptor
MPVVRTDRCTCAARGERVFGRGKNIEAGLTRTRRSFFGRIGEIFSQRELSDEVWEELEELLIQADVGVSTTMDLVQGVRDAADSQGWSSASQVEEALRQRLRAILGVPFEPRLNQDGLWITLVVGVNGSGKTTSIAKLARYHQEQGRKVLLAAADTFRAAASDQLKVWGERLGVEVVAHQPGADPAAVVFDAVQAGQARGVDTLIVDTAGRLHTQYNLMQELSKIHRVIRKQKAEAPQETLLVLDATTGQNALSQAKYFQEAVDVDGVFLAKLDGTAKGGIVFAIVTELGIPIRYVGTGEELDDVAEFDPERFVRGLFENSTHQSIQS